MMTYLKCDTAVAEEGADSPTAAPTPLMRSHILLLRVDANYRSRIII
jgi:hypothetical protein